MLIWFANFIFKLGMVNNNQLYKLKPSRYIFKKYIYIASLKLIPAWYGKYVILIEQLWLIAI